MASIAEQQITDLKTQIQQLKAENDYLRSRLEQKQIHIEQLEDAALTLAEREILLAKKLPAS